MSRRIGAFVALAAVLAALFVRLGFWQLGRLGERRARNASLAARLAEPVAPFERLPPGAAYRRVVVRGTPDPANEIVLTGRSRNGSPGVYIITPLRRTTSDTAVLVVRGWVYSPDAATIDLSQWREDRGEYTGYVNPLATSASPQVSTASGTQRANQRRVRALSLPSVASLLPYPVAPVYVVARDSATGNVPVRLPMLALDDGPHLSYAIQWFAFAAIALIGAGAVILKRRAPQSGGATDA